MVLKRLILPCTQRKTIPHQWSRAAVVRQGCTLLRMVWNLVTPSPCHSTSLAPCTSDTSQPRLQQRISSRCVDCFMIQPVHGIRHSTSEIISPKENDTYMLKTAHFAYKFKLYCLLSLCSSTMVCGLCVGLSDDPRIPEAGIGWACSW